MTVFAPVYRATIFASDGTTPLTPIAGAPHTDELKVATAKGVTGFQPYLDFPAGRRGRVDFLERTVDTGQLTLRILDVRNTPGGSNFSRWLTAFVGNTEGQEQIAGKRVFVEESHDGGTTYRDYFTGRVQSIGTDGRLFLTLQLADLAEDMSRAVFVGLPNRNASSAAATPLFPLGLSDPFGGMDTVPKAQARMETRTTALFGARSALVLELGQFKEDRTNPDGDIVTKTLKDLVVKEQQKVGTRITGPRLRIRIKILEGARAGEEGHLTLKPGILNRDVTGSMIDWQPDGNGHQRVVTIGVQPLEDAAGEPLTADPDFIVLPPIGDLVEFDMIRSGEPTKDTPLLINDVHPFQLLKDLLDGLYGRLQDGVVTGTFGDPAWNIPYDATEMAARIADDSWGTRRFIIKEPADDMREWIEEFGLSVGFGYHLDASGDFRSIDLRRPTSAAGAPTVSAEDLNVEGTAPAWIHTREDAVTGIIASYYIDFVIPRSDIVKDPDEFPDASATTIESDTNQVAVLNFADPDLPENDLKINAIGFRAFSSDADDGQSDIVRVEAELFAMIEELKGPYKAGSSQVTVPLRRESTGFLSFTIGDLVILDIDELPDPQTNLRGGARLVRCSELTEDGPTILATFVDLGINATADVPVLGNLVLTPGSEAISIDVPVTANAAGEPVQVAFAITPVAVATVPLETSPLWQFGFVTLATATRALSPLPSGLRIWVRARTLPQDANALKIPSAWIFPPNSKLDLSSLPTISGGVAAGITGSTADLSWVNGSSDFDIEVHLKQGADEQRIERLPAGSSAYLIEFLDVSTAYTVRFRYVDGNGGQGPFHDIAFSTTGTFPTCPDLKGMVLLVGQAV